MATHPSTHDQVASTIASSPIADLERRWIALHDQARQIAAMADLTGEPMAPLIERFSKAMAYSDIHWHKAALGSLGDIELLVELGLKALKEVDARRQDPVAPALALWREFYHAREAVLVSAQPIAA